MHGLRDRNGRLLFSEGLEDEQALAGHNVYLTIDKGIQFTAERELNAAMKTYEAVGGSVVVVDPQSGEILALASAPGYNPNDYSEADPDTRRNRAIVDRFEPGSVMKVFAVATALAQKSVSPTASIYCEEGTMAIDNVVIHDTHVSKWLTITQNPGHLVEHRRRQDRARARRVPALRGVPALRLRRHDGHPLPRRVDGRAPPARAPLGAGGDGDGGVRAGHQRDRAPARHGHGRDRQPRASARAGARQARDATARA